jgi:hypothetical protein
MSNISCGPVLGLEMVEAIAHESNSSLLFATFSNFRASRQYSNNPCRAAILKSELESLLRLSENSECMPPIAGAAVVSSITIIIAHGAGSKVVKFENFSTFDLVLLKLVV